MDHRTIEEEGLAELYATGRLSPAQEEELEIHLLECRECRERVAWADDLRGAVSDVAAEDAARAAAGLGFLAWLARRRVPLMAFGLAALAGLAAFLFVEQARLRGELAAARAAAERPAPAPIPERPAGKPAADPAELERLARQRDLLEEELREERAAREGLADRLARLARPQVNTAIYSLGLVRGEADANVVELGSAPEWIVLSLELPAPGPGPYRAALLDSRGATVWRGEGLRPTAMDTLDILFPSRLLPSGSYRLRLEGAAGEPAGEIPFRVRG